MTGVAGFKCAMRRAFLHGHRAAAATATAADVSTVIVATDEPTVVGPLMQAVYNHFLAKGLFTRPDGTVETIDQVNWLALIQELLKDLPAILAIILPLLGM